MRKKNYTYISLLMQLLMFSQLISNELFAQDTSFNKPYYIGRFSQAFDTYDQTRCITNDYHKPIYIHDSLNYVISNGEYIKNYEHIKQEYAMGGAMYYVVKLDTPMKLGVQTSHIPLKMNGVYLHIAIKRFNRYFVIYSGLGNGTKTLEDILEQGLDLNQNLYDDAGKLHVNNSFNLYPDIYYIIVSGFAFRHGNVSDGCMQLRIYGEPIDPNDSTINFLSIDSKLQLPQTPEDSATIEDTNREENNKLNLSDRNSYIYSVTYTSKDTTRYLENIKYYDGLGRLKQIIDRNATPTFKDIVKAYEYDMEDRMTREWLPISVINNNEGNYINMDILSSQSNNYYQDSAYTDFNYNFLPFNRNYMITKPGRSYKEWYRATKNNYLFNKGQNGDLACMMLTCSNSQEILITKNGYYTNGELYVQKEITEENAVSYTFTNKNGQTLLVRQIKNQETYDTYYIYDDYGNLRVVFPPLASDKIKIDATQLNINSETCKKFAYLYTYDDFNRCVWKKLPGVEPFYYIYDAADQLIFTQDGEQRLKGEWAFSIPDFLGRVCLTGVYKNTGIIQSNFSDKVITATYSENNSYGYEINNFSLQSEFYIWTINFYDNYKWASNFPELIYDEAKENEYGKLYGKVTTSSHHMGLLTGVATRLFDNSNRFLYSAMYYDDRGRLIQSSSQNHLGGVDRVYSAYNFIGQPIKNLSKQKVSVNGKELITTELQTYRYDHAGRLKENRHQLNGTNQIMAILNEYDEIGRLKSVERNVYKETTIP